jgi:hypothetical protein
MISSKVATLVVELQSISPMPDDDTLNHLPDENDPLEKLQNILSTLKQETQVQYPLDLILPLLEVFGVGTGNGVFWSILTLIEQYPNLEEVYPLIQQATKSANAGTRVWSCRLLGRRRQEEDELFFIARLQDEVAEVRQSALTGILMLAQRYDMTHLIPVVESLLQDENWEVQDVAEDTLEILREPKK